MYRKSCKRTLLRSTTYSASFTGVLSYCKLKEGRLLVQELQFERYDLSYFDGLTGQAAV